MRPANRLLVIIAIWLCLSLLAIFIESILWLWLALGLILFILILADGILLFSLNIPQIKRSVPGALSLGVPCQVDLIIKTRNNSPSQIYIYDHHPQCFQVSGLPQRIILSHQKENRDYKINYKIKPNQRGKIEFGHIACLLLSFLGLWWRHVLCGNKDYVRVYPNFQAVIRYTLLAVAGKVEQLGIRKRQKRGQGLEFQQLREYIPGDSIRLIDWKVTSKYHKLISRQYQEEQDQQIVFLLDCGFRMHTKDGEISHFDSALNALILLSYVALKQGDSIGLMTYGGERRWLAPVKGTSSLNYILNNVYDLQTSLTPSDLTKAIEDVMMHLKRRSLIILMTNIREEDANNLISIMHTTQKRHLVLAASLRQKALTNALKQKINSFKDALHLTSVHYYLNKRIETQNRLKATGMLYLDDYPENFAATLVNRYLDIKTKGLL